MNRKNHGFTLVELIIVIVVIGILATIALVAYSSIQNRANDSAVLSDLTNIQKKLELAKVDLGHYPQATSEFPTGFKFNRSAYDFSLNNIYYITDKTNDRYALGVRSKSMKGFMLTDAGRQDATTINSNTTAAAIGITWGATNTFGRQAYDTGLGWMSASMGPWTAD